MEFVNGFLIDVPEFRQMPIYISPFSEPDVWQNKLVAEGFSKTSFLSFNNSPAVLTESATQALELALRELNLKPEDEVWVLTTTGNSYISGCVTRTIDKFCRWQREFSAYTRAILVNHEFGFAYQNLSALKKYGLPIIEDAAYSMFSQNQEQSLGRVGDYVIYSLAKMFPVQAGGILVSNSSSALQMQKLKPELESYFAAVLQVGLAKEADIIGQRIQNHQRFAEAFLKMDITPRFELVRHDVPGAFLFRAPNKNLHGLKDFLQRNGVECSVFYGEETFYIPSHQNIAEKHIQYLVTLINYFFEL